MALAIGTRLGPYQIQTLIGAGGMGEVYRALDTRLGRQVAIKILPPQANSDQERVRRFQQEARAAGMLNHPNILTIFDVGEEEGKPYVVSELLEGETLRERLQQSRIPVRRAIELSQQVARGLAAAHERGIVHRDLKPENLFLTKEGSIKILDFGLAKLLEPAALEEGKSFMPTVSGSTTPGVLLGTVGYMSPEQVQGKSADHRSDLFAFGAILYEMLSGKRAFVGDSSVETLNAILKVDPPELSTGDAQMPPALESIVRHCLEKSPDRRFHSAHDLAFALETVSQTGASTILQPAKRVRMPAGIPFVLLVLALAAAFFAGWYFLRKPAEVPTFQRLTFRRGSILSARFAPDGTVVYGASWEGMPFQVYTTRRENPESRPMEINGDPLAVSSSEELLISLNRHFYIGYVSKGTLARVPLIGGVPREILESMASADWHPKTGEIAVARNEQGNGFLEFPPGKQIYQTPGSIGLIRFSPDGEQIAMLDHPDFGDNAGSVSVVNLKGEKKSLTERFGAIVGLAWNPKKKAEIWFSASTEGDERNLYAVNLDGKQRVVSRMAVDLVLQDISSKGEVLLSAESGRRGISGVFEGEHQERDLSWFDWSFPSALSPDGKILIFEEHGSGAGKSYGVFIRKIDGSPAVRIADGRSGGMTPDGKWVLVASYPKWDRLFFTPTGAGSPRDIPNLGIRHYEWYGLSSNGNEVIMIGRKESGEQRLYVQDLQQNTLKEIGAGMGGDYAWAISPDGKMLAVPGTGSVLTFVPLSGEPPIAHENIRGLVPVKWDREGKGVYVFDSEKLPSQIYHYEYETRTLTPWKEIKPADPAGIQDIGPVLLSEDEKSLVYGYRRVLSDLFIASGLQ